MSISTPPSQTCELLVAEITGTGATVMVVDAVADVPQPLATTDTLAAPAKLGFHVMVPVVEVPETVPAVPGVNDQV